MRLPQRQVESICLRADFSALVTESAQQCFMLIHFFEYAQW